jgi:hypothetical protein
MKLRHTNTQPGEQQAEQLHQPRGKHFTVEVRPPRNQKIPATPIEFIKGITEFQTGFLKIRNRSPLACFEIRRSKPGQVQLQFTAPTKRLERKIRTHLTNNIPGIRFKDGVNGLPITSEETIGGGILTTGESDWYPLQTSFDSPPTNSVISSLHRHAMQDTKILIQVLFQPVAGQPLRRWFWSKQAYHSRNYLKKEKQRLWGSRSPTNREKRQADSIDDKAGKPRFHTSIRILVVGAGEYTKSRVKEISGGFNTYENSETGQYLNTNTVETLREKRILSYAEAVRDRRLAGWSHRFQTTQRELAALTAIPRPRQENIRGAEP